MSGSPAFSTTRCVVAALSLLLIGATAGTPTRAQGRREFTVTAHKFAFEVSGSDKREIRVALGDLVRITFQAEDIPHSFTTVEASPHYRIDRRAEPGKPITFDFRADQAGTVPIQCTLTMESGCREMAAVLIVEAKR